VVYILISVLIACITIGVTVWLSNRSANRTIRELNRANSELAERVMKHATEVMERVNEHTDKVLGEVFSKTYANMEAFYKMHQEHLDALAKYFAEKKEKSEEA
jgi:predicted metal-dependent phosphoesterase TrpH